MNVLRWISFVLFWPFMIAASLLPIVAVVVFVLMLFDVFPGGSLLAIVLATVGAWIISWVLFLVSPTRAKKHFDGFGDAASDAGELVDAFFYYSWMLRLWWNILRLLWWLVSAPFRLIASIFD
ncbi:hypothetical protein [Brevibacterium litoralis]|uniref:hypothetical protein n=1 Tax=Brevibacterium litoralis TaxID=3138935 RepID=UPI0032EEA563